MNLAARLLAGGGDRPERVAVVEDDDAMSYSDLARVSESVAGRLVGEGVRPGDRVALVLPNGLDFVVAYLGVLWAGAVAVPLNPQSPGPELAHELARVETSVVLDSPGLAREASPAAGSDGGEGDDGAASDALVAPVPTTPGVPVERADSEPAVLLFTSGTAGAPQAAVLTHGNLAANIHQVLSHPDLVVTPADVGLATLPFFHVFGLNVALGVGLAGGIRSVILSAFDPVRAVELIRRERVTIFAGVPTMYRAFLDLDDVAAPSDSFATVRLAVSGAAPLEADLVDALRARFGFSPTDGYGLTEASPIVSAAAIQGADAPGSIGRPLPGVEVRLVDTEGGDALVGDPGEIRVRGPNVFAGYFRDEVSTRAVLDAEGWLHTGDIAVADKGGCLYLVDRAKDLVIVSGFNVYPAEVEDVLRGYAGVADAAVAGVPNVRTGEAVVAWVVPEAGAAPDPDAVREHVARHLARYKVPATVEVVESLPRDPTGKLLRRRLFD